MNGYSGASIILGEATPRTFAGEALRRTGRLIHFRCLLPAPRAAGSLVAHERWSCDRLDIRWHGRCQNG